MISEFQEYQIAVNTFKQKYFALPGDMPNATQFWGSASGASCNHGTFATGTGTQTYNGDGDGRITYGGNSNKYTEMFMFWQHLANAEMVKGTFTGRSGSGFMDHAIINQNVPASKVSNAGFTLNDDLMPENIGNSNNSEYGRSTELLLHFGTNFTNHELYNPVLTTEEAWNIDKKIDDGIASTGKIVIDKEFQTTYLCGTTSIPRNYNLSNSGIRCALFFRE